MRVYTVHEPPLRAADASADPQRFVFVRDGFSLWAFLLTPFWMLWHGLWLVLILYLVASIGLETALHVLGGSTFVIALVGILISLLVGLEAGTLRRFTLRRRGWRDVGVVGGDRVEDAERRFFDAWVQQPPTRVSTATTATPAVRPVTPPPSSSEAPGVVGLFPEPGAQR
jgi:hypothetical protein